MNQTTRVARTEKQYKHCIMFSKGQVNWLPTSNVELLEHGVGGGILMRKVKETLRRHFIHKTMKSC